MLKKTIKNIWLSDFLVKEDKKIINKTLKYIYKNNRPFVILNTKLFIKDCIKKDFNNISILYTLDIIKKHSYLFVFDKDDNKSVRLSYYGYLHYKKGGYCIGYYIMNFISLRFIFNKAKSYIFV
jgi:hypothetical protein